MSSKGIEGLMIETHSFKASAAFWTDLGFVVEHEADGSGQLRHPSGGPYVYIVERPEGSTIELQPVVGLEQSKGFEPPSGAEVAVPFKARPWGVDEMLVRDPDGRRISLQAPNE